MNTLTSTETKAGRPPTRRRAIVERLKRDILNGRLRAGDPLPTRASVQASSRAGIATVQNAFEVLIREGFACVSNGATFVADRPPHLHRFALVFPEEPGTLYPSFVFASIRESARLMERRGEHRFDMYFIERPERPDFQRLVGDLQARRLAGVIFTAPPPPQLMDPALVGPRAVPCAAIAGDLFTPYIPAVNYDARSFITLALDRLADRGRRRIALVTVPPNPGFIPVFDAELARRGMTIQPYWRLYLRHSDDTGVRTCAHLLFNPNQTDRPDGLVIGDDSLVEQATAGIAAAGVRVPTDLDIVAHCNFPHPPPGHLPVYRVGFNTIRMLETCISVIQRQRKAAPGTRVRNSNAMPMVPGIPGVPGVPAVTRFMATTQDDPDGRVAAGNVASLVSGS